MSVVGDFRQQLVVGQRKIHPYIFRSGVSGDVVQRFLEDQKQMAALIGIELVFSISAGTTNCQLMPCESRFPQHVHAPNPDWESKF